MGMEQGDRFDACSRSGRETKNHSIQHAVNICYYKRGRPANFAWTPTQLAAFSNRFPNQEIPGGNILPMKFAPPRQKPGILQTKCSQVLGPHPCQQLIEEKPFLDIEMAALIRIAADEVRRFLTRKFELKHCVSKIIGGIGHSKLVLSLAVMFKIRLHQPGAGNDPFSRRHLAVSHDRSRAALP